MLPKHNTTHNATEGFTLVELSIVLVIIGLIVGGILVGQDLITAARIRAQISQIEKYNSALNAFRVKYNAIPGDMIPGTAAALGFFPRTGVQGDGDGDGYICSLRNVPFNDDCPFMLGHETVLFWTDLSSAGLIEGGFNDNSDAGVNANTDAQIAAEVPRARIGNANFIFANGEYFNSNNTYVIKNGFQISRIISVGPPFTPGVVCSKAAMTALESFSIDNKIDDGLPTSGKVIVMWPDSTGGPNEIVGQAANFPEYPSLCMLQGPPITYNTGTPGVSTVANCSLRFQGQW